MQAIVDGALDPAWGNRATSWSPIQVPGGTTFYEGAAAAQRGLVGGGNQVFLPSIDNSCVVGRGSSEMPPDGWDEIHGFASRGEYQRFQRWIADAIEEGVLVEVPVATPYSGSPMFDERWYRAPSGGIWRVVAPEPPFKGVFERVP